MYLPILDVFACRRLMVQSVMLCRRHCRIVNFIFFLPCYKVWRNPLEWRFWGSQSYGINYTATVFAMESVHFDGVLQKLHTPTCVWIKAETPRGIWMKNRRSGDIGWFLTLWLCRVVSRHGESIQMADSTSSKYHSFLGSCAVR